MPRSLESLLTLLAVVALAACGGAQQGTGAAATDAGAHAQTEREDKSSQLMAAGVPPDATQGTGLSGNLAIASAGTHGASGGTGPAGTAGSTTGLGSGGSAAASGGAVASAAGGGASAMAAAGGVSGSLAAGSGAGAQAQAGFTLTPVGLDKANDTELAFPADAINSVSISPELMWSGVPPEAKSLALVFRDLSMSIVKWIVWDIPPTIADLPKGISQDSGMLKEIPGAMQLGALGHQGYYGPCCTANHYEWVLWALDVEKLPVSAGQTTETIRDMIIPAHQLASTPPVLMRRVTP